MPCLRCGEKKTIEAHLIPKAFVMEVKRDSGEQLLLVHKGIARPKVSHTGLYDRDILCAECDGILGRHECYVHSLLQKMRKTQAAPGTLIPINPLDGDSMVRFAAGIAWKFGVTKQSMGKISLGPYSSVLAEVAFGKKEIPSSIDVAIFRLVELDGDVYYYRAPLLDRKDNINMVRFSVGGFVFFLKTDRRRNGHTLPPQCWLRGRAQGQFLVAPGDRFEEGTLHAELAGRPPVRRFFQKMRERSTKE